MRLAIVNSYRSIVGGIETYLCKLLPALAERGHDVAFFHEETAAGHELIALPEGANTWSVAELGTERALDALQQWQPDIIYLHGLRSPELETEMRAIAPVAFFAHAYYGSCVSGTKTFSFPQAEPCDRQFGWQCLLHYYPRRCGGLSPLTMVREYGLQTKRLSLLHNYGAIIVASSHMLREYEKYGLADKLSLVRLPVTIEAAPDITLAQDGRRHREKWRILFLARMESLKGGAALLEALPAVARASEIPVHVTFAGEGRRRKEWEQRAAQLASGNHKLELEFTGWLDESQRAEVLSECDLLVMPSLWPEPFGLAGVEAGLFGVPVVAFEVGGITDWLKDGFNGVLAPGNPPSAGGLAAAIVRCMRDENFYLSLRSGAVERAQQFKMKEHLSALLDIFERLALKS